MLRSRQSRCRRRAANASGNNPGASSAQFIVQAPVAAAARCGQFVDFASGLPWRGRCNSPRGSLVVYSRDATWSTVTATHQRHAGPVSGYPAAWSLTPAAAASGNSARGAWSLGDEARRPTGWRLTVGACAGPPARSAKSAGHQRRVSMRFPQHGPRAFGDGTPFSR